MVKSTQIKRVLRDGEREASLAGGLPSSDGTAWYGVVVKDIARRCQMCMCIPVTTAIRNTSIRHSSKFQQSGAISAINIFSSLLPAQRSDTNIIAIVYAQGRLQHGKTGLTRLA